MTTFSVIGAGAVGGYYGARLAEAGHKVTFVFQKDADYVRDNGFHVTSPLGDINLENPSCVAASSDLEPADVVIVAVKATVNGAIVPDIAAALKPDGMVLLIQNGINGEIQYAQALSGDQSVVGAIALIAAERTERNKVEHFSLGSLKIGKYLDGYKPAGDDERLNKLAKLLEDAKIPTEVESSLLSARWQKLLWNGSFNPVSVLANMNSKEMTEEPHVAELVKRIMNEYLAAAQADGCSDLTQNDCDLMFQSSVYMTPYLPSMRVDADHGRLMEVDALLGEPLKRAAVNGVSMPSTQVIFELMSARNTQMS